MRYVFLSTDDNPVYRQFWPLASTAWRRWGIEPILAYATDRPPAQWTHMEKWGTVVPFSVRRDMPARNWAKLARWHLYYMFPESKGIVACIDMLPLNRGYFDGLFSYPIDALVLASFDAYDDEPGAPRKVPGNYMVATGEVWRKIVNPDSVDLDTWAQSWHGCRVFDAKENPLVSPSIFSEESMMRVAINRALHRYNIRVAALPRPGGWGVGMRRLDRSDRSYSPAKVSDGWYLDAHLPRPGEPRGIESEYMAGIADVCRLAGLDGRLIYVGAEEARR